jgi:hypothetical protein
MSAGLLDHKIMAKSRIKRDVENLLFQIVILIGYKGVARMEN